MFAQVLYLDGRKAPFSQLRVDIESKGKTGKTVVTPLVIVNYNPKKTDPYLFQYKLKNPDACLWLVLIDENGEAKQRIISSKHSYTFRTEGDSSLTPKADPESLAKIVHVADDLARRATEMIELLAAAQIASIAGNAVTILDKIYAQFVSFKQKKPPNEVVPSPSMKISNEPDQGQISSRLVDRGEGQICQVVTYEELRTRLQPEDLSYINTVDKTLRIYEKQWSQVYSEVPLTSGMQKAQLESQLEVLSKNMGKELGAILTFLEDRLGMRLDDHYQAIRHIVGQ